MFYVSSRFPIKFAENLLFHIGEEVYVVRSSGVTREVVDLNLLNDNTVIGIVGV